MMSTPSREHLTTACESTLQLVQTGWASGDTWTKIRVEPGPDAHSVVVHDPNDGANSSVNGVCVIELTLVTWVS